MSTALEALESIGYDFCSCGKTKRIVSVKCRGCWRKDKNNGADGTKYCNGCKLTKSVSDFTWNGPKNRYRSRCKPCESQATKEYTGRLDIETKRAKKRMQYEKEKESGASKRHAFRAYWKSLGFNPDDVEKFVDAHNGICDICGATEKIKVDHCHTTLVLRGLLCQTCNFGLGNFRDSTELLEKAIDYIKNAPPI